MVVTYYFTMIHFCSLVPKTGLGGQQERSKKNRSFRYTATVLQWYCSIDDQKCRCPGLVKQHDFNASGVTDHNTELPWGGEVLFGHHMRSRGKVECWDLAAVALTPVLRSCQKPFTADTRFWVPTITTASFPSPPLFPDSRAFGARHQNVRLNKESPSSKWRFFSTSFLRREGEHFLPAYPLCCAGFTQRGSAAVDIGSLSDELFVNTHTKFAHSNGDLCRPRKTMPLPRCELGKRRCPSEYNGLQSAQSPPQSGQTALEH